MAKITEKELRRIVLEGAAKASRRLHECGCGCSMCSGGTESGGLTIATNPQVVGGPGADPYSYSPDAGDWNIEMIAYDTPTAIDVYTKPGLTTPSFTPPKAPARPSVLDWNSGESWSSDDFLDSMVNGIASQDSGASHYQDSPGVDYGQDAEEEYAYDELSDALSSFMPEANSDEEYTEYEDGDSGREEGDELLLGGEESLATWGQRDTDYHAPRQTMDKASRNGSPLTALNHGVGLNEFNDDEDVTAANFGRYQSASDDKYQPMSSNPETVALSVTGFGDPSAAYNALISMGVSGGIADEVVDYADESRPVYLGSYTQDALDSMCDKLDAAGITWTTENEDAAWSDEDMAYEEEDPGFVVDGSSPWAGAVEAAETALEALENAGLSVNTEHIQSGLLRVSSDVPLVTVRRLVDTALPSWRNDQGDPVYVVLSPMGIIVQF